MNIDTFLGRDAYIAEKPAREFMAGMRAKAPRTFLGRLHFWASKKHRALKRFEAARLAHNQHFIERELTRHAAFFDDIEGRKLDRQQRVAVVADENNSLVIAGAGSGKTSTIVAKIKYLMEIQGVPADQIVPISFTNKSAADMKQRINIAGITPQTFHKLGLTVVETVQRRKPQIYDETKTNILFRGYLNDLSKDQKYLADLNNFFLHYLRIPKSQFDFAKHGDYIQYLKDQNFTTYRRVAVPHQGLQTYKNETVKSIEECMIGNFLLFNRVDYMYEAPYQVGYKPDFTLQTKTGSKVYLEHLGMDEKGNVPPFFASQGETRAQASRRYQDSLEWKRKLHTTNHTTMVESYSYQFRDGTLLDTLRSNLHAAGVTLQPMTDTEIWQVIQTAGKDQVEGFISLCQTFLALQKSNGHTVADIRGMLVNQNTSGFMTQRSELFLKLYAPLYNRYQAGLTERGEIDFNDMISQATGYIANRTYVWPVRYVIVDEFQDLSFGRYRLLQAIRKQNPDVKFYCVGDDFQSIYRFAGSDIALFKDFEKYFGFTFRAKIETTYRFNQPMIDLSSNFILKNPNQTAKTLRAAEGRQPTTYNLIESDGGSMSDDTLALEQAITALLKRGLTPDSSVYIIGRYNFDLQRIKNTDKRFAINTATGLVRYRFMEGDYVGQELELQFVTAHKSKGLEADYTILINCNSGKYGFPSGRTDDPILNLLLSSADQYENGEERRLFYVAMTRAKRHVTLVSDERRKSKFIKEVETIGGVTAEDSVAEICPKCGDGELVKRVGKGYSFYGCTNYGWGCNYTAR